MRQVNGWRLQGGGETSAVTPARELPRVVGRDHDGDRRRSDAAGRRLFWRAVLRGTVCLAVFGVAYWVVSTGWPASGIWVVSALVAAQFSPRW